MAALPGCYKPARYFALAHMLPTLGENIAQEICEGDGVLLRAHDFEPDQFLGRRVFDDEYTHSSAPQYSFRDYVGSENLPRAAVIPGPHDYDCVCLACTQFTEMMAEHRARREARETREPGRTNNT